MNCICLYSILGDGPGFEKETAGDGSMQRRRTAWMSSFGHDRITKEELDLRYFDRLETRKNIFFHT